MTARSPLADATGVAVDVTVTAELSEALDPATVTATSVTLIGRHDRGPRERRLRRADRHHQPDPTTDLEPGTTYTVSLGTTIDGPRRQHPGRHHWDFATVNPTDTTPPDAPVITTPAGDGYDLDGDLTLAGSAEAASTVELFDGATSKGTTTATAGGTWTIALTGVADGVHVYTAKATDAAPNTSPASAARTITVDTAAPTVTDRSPLADATGVAVDVTVTAELSEALDPATVTATSVTLTGPGSTAVPATVDYDELTDTISLNPDRRPRPRHDLHGQPRGDDRRSRRPDPGRHHVGLRHDQPHVCSVLAVALLVRPGEPAVQPRLGRG